MLRRRKREMTAALECESVSRGDEHKVVDTALASSPFSTASGTSLSDSSASGDEGFECRLLRDDEEDDVEEEADNEVSGLIFLRLALLTTDVSTCAVEDIKASISRLISEEHLERRGISKEVPLRW